MPMCRPSARRPAYLIFFWIRSPSPANRSDMKNKLCRHFRVEVPCTFLVLSDFALQIFPQLLVQYIITTLQAYFTSFFPFLFLTLLTYYLFTALFALPYHRFPSKFSFPLVTQLSSFSCILRHIICLVFLWYLLSLHFPVFLCVSTNLRVSLIFTYILHIFYFLRIRMNANFAVSSYK